VVSVATGQDDYSQQGIRPTSLGGLLYTWKYGWGLRISLTLVVLLFAQGLIFAVLEKDLIMQMMSLTFMLPLTVFAVRSWTSRFQVYSEGVRRRGWGFSRNLRYDQIESMVFWTNHEIDWNVGVSSGPTDAGKRIHLILRPTKESREKTIRFDMWRMASVPPAFETLCENAAFAVAQRMKQRIASGARIKWGRHATFTNQGLLIRPRRFIFFRGAEQHVQTGPFFRGVSEGNHFRIYETGCSRPVFSISCRTPDFHAGQIVFTSLCSQTSDSEGKLS
jgi:hypothetical protein